MKTQILVPSRRPRNRPPRSIRLASRKGLGGRRRRPAGQRGTARAGVTGHPAPRVSRRVQREVCGDGQGRARANLSPETGDGNRCGDAKTATAGRINQTVTRVSLTVCLLTCAIALAPQYSLGKPQGTAPRFGAPSRFGYREASNFSPRPPPQDPGCAGQTAAPARAMRPACAPLRRQPVAGQAAGHA
jgi:hypothetical protein